MYEVIAQLHPVLLPQTKSKACSNTTARDVPRYHDSTMTHSRTMPEARSTARVIRRSGDSWSIREMDARLVPGARADHCLICESTDVIRRVWHYPSNWHDLSDDELWHLCESAP